ncbi:LOW QUALITY PROTEIN: lactosylceramide alpha-2,3-sialyltransferase-like [Accipiter gentilis]|uniref:LOW QUALITY PROTEIN: lactosylceramide alpha-2,3-sialyltransferase-like n=1 Tax=Astur gentilis TaxID=8957 RepID=UPI0021103F3C|nr:LOW QUALITY PROTEIN: lactosylceramide alpha-2,3-sialyltransferase-like [Accipiter gentilis]
MRGGGADHTSASGFRSCQTPAQAWARSWQATARESLQGSSLQPAQEMAAGTLLSQDLRLAEDGQVPMVPGFLPQTGQPPPASAALPSPASRPPELSLILRHNLKAFRKLVGNEPSFFHWRHLGACQRCFVWRMPFLGRFGSHWKPFLTSKSLYSLMGRPLRRDLEKVLWFHKLPFRLQSSVLSAFTTLQFLPQQELPGSFVCLWCQRCIVVGSIHGQRFGKMIDAYHVIIRLNDAPVKEHKKDVGERTSTCLFFPESALPNTLENNSDDELMVFVPFKPLDFSWLMEVLLKTRKKPQSQPHWRQPLWEYNGNISQLHTLNPYVTYEAMYKLLQLNTSSRRYATTGITALNLALHMCQEVNIAGFGYPCNHDNTTPIHYYNMDRSLKKELCQHNIAAERSWLLEMIEWGMTADIASPSFQAQTAERGLCCLLSPSDTTDDPSWASPLFQDAAMSYFPFFTSLVDTFFLACYHHGFTSAASPKCCLYKQKEPTVMKLQADGYAGTRSRSKGNRSSRLIFHQV